jgi:hypothetical protein
MQLTLHSMPAERRHSFVKFLNEVGWLYAIALVIAVLVPGIMSFISGID